MSTNIIIFILGFFGEGKGRWPSEWGGPASGEIQYHHKKHHKSVKILIEKHHILLVNFTTSKTPQHVVLIVVFCCGEIHHIGFSQCYVSFVNGAPRCSL